MLRVEETRRYNLISLNDFIGYNNITFPYVSTITSTDYPEQNEDYIGQEFALWYMDYRVHEKKRGIFTVVRWDAEVPNRVILINDDLQIILVTGDDKVLDDGKGETDELGHAVSNAYIHEFPIQRTELLGINTRDEFSGDFNTNTGIVIRADWSGNNPEYVIYEKLDDERVRLLTLAECRAVVQTVDINVKRGPTETDNLDDENNEYWPTDWGLNKDETDTASETE